MTIKEKKVTAVPVAPVANPKENIILKTIREGYNLPDAYFAALVKKAQDKKDGTTVLNLEQLTEKRYQDFYVDTDKVRYGRAISPLEQRLKNPLPPYSKQLFSGITGSGKTMELIKLCYRLKKSFNVIIFSVMSRLRIDVIAIEPLLFEIVGDLLEYVYSNDLVDESDEQLKNIVATVTGWYSSAGISKGEIGDYGHSLKAGLVFLRDIFFAAKTDRRFYSEDKAQLLIIEDQKINELIVECNKIFSYLKEKTRKETLIIVDDLEKMLFLKAREFFIKNASFFRDFQCKMVLTIPIELVFHTDFTSIWNVFGVPETLPMIMVRDKDGKEYRQGVNTLVEIVKRRLDLSLFEKECYLAAVKNSGGIIRDLFRIIQRAALGEKSGLITEKAMQKSIDHFKDYFVSNIQARGDDIKIENDEYVGTLLDIFGANQTAPEKNVALLDLIRNRAVIKYENYYATHPLLDDYLKSKKKVEKGEMKTPGPLPIDNGYLKEIEIVNFFCIENIKLDNLQDKKEIYIVGENGDGKTIFLQSILLAFKGDKNVGEIVNFLNDNPRHNYYLKAAALDDERPTYVFSEIESGREYVAKNVFAYGVHRSRNDSDRADEHGYLTLFREDSYLKSPVKWLQYLHHKEKAKEPPPIDLETAVNMLKSLLDQNVEIEVTPDHVIFVERKTRVSFSQLADGYKSVIIWVCDLLEKLSKNQPGVQRTQDFKGIVLVDEIELFLHPKWKNKIVRNLRRWFPGIQFIFTTHSATVILGASRDAVFYKLYKEGGVTKVSQPVLKISHLMMNALVTSPLFGLESAHARSFEDDVPVDLDSAVFQDDILDKITNAADKTFMLQIYKEAPSQQGAGGTTYILKDDLNSTELDRLIKILIAVGYKEQLHTGIDFLYFKIHREVENRIKKMNNLTEDDIVELVQEELDKYEETFKT